MASNATGHHPDKAGGKVQIDPQLWAECQRIQPGQQVPLGLVDGSRVYLANANKIMVAHDMDFTQGGNDLEDPWFGRNFGKPCLILDDRVRPDDWKFILYHEALERRMMTKGWSYDRAHRLANAHERELRKQWLTKSPSPQG